VSAPHSRTERWLCVVGQIILDGRLPAEYDVPTNYINLARI